MMMTAYQGNNCGARDENNTMKFGSFFSRKASREYGRDERDRSINHNKEQDDQNAAALWVVEFSSFNGRGGGGGCCWIQLSLPPPTMPNSATHLRVGVVS